MVGRMAGRSHPDNHPVKILAAKKASQPLEIVSQSVNTLFLIKERRTCMKDVLILFVVPSFFISLLFRFVM